MAEALDDDGVIDLEAHAHAGKPIPAHGNRFRIRIDEEFFMVDDPIVTGQQLLETAGKFPVDEHLVFQVLQNRQIEEIRLDEAVDLRQGGIEHFMIWRSDRSFRFVIDGRRFEWGAPLITGLKLKQLTEVDPATHDVWLEVRGAEDRPINDDEKADLRGEGVERFFTAPKPPLTFEIIVNARPRVVTGSQVTFEQIVQLAFPGSQAEQNVVFSMTYRHAASKPHAGELGPGGIVEVKKGTIFNVTKTVQS